jgi:nucleoside-diphosphate-sugar epimerase
LISHNRVYEPNSVAASGVVFPTGRRRGRRGRPRLLIVGCGDVGTRILRLLATRMRVFAVTSQPSRRAELREAGAIPLVADLDRPATLAGCRGWRRGSSIWRRRPGRAMAIRAHARCSAPCAAPHGAARAPRALASVSARPPFYPSGDGTGRLRRRSGIGRRRLRLRQHHRRLWRPGRARVQEFHAVRPQTARARRRVAAEAAVRDFGRKAGWRVNIVRIPGIYAADRLPVARLNKGTPALAPQDDVYTSHIHADDLARTMIAALWRGRPQRVVHASDDTELRMADYFDLVADRKGLPRPPRIAATGATTIDPTLLSFMSESRRLDNRRLKRELRLKLRYPTVASFFDR